MSILDDDAVDDLYQEKEIVLEEQDLRLLKGVLTHADIAREFANSNTSKLFLGDAKPFVDDVLALYQQHGDMPTRRIMLEGADGEKSEVYSQIWDNLDQVTFNRQEYNYDLDKLRQRYTHRKIYSMQKAIEEGQDVDEVLLQVKRNLDDAEKVRRGDKKSAFIQRTMKDYLNDFRADYVQKQKDPDKGRGILTQYSYLDYVTNGMAPSDMLIIGGETGAGKSMLLSNMAVQMWMQDNDPTRWSKEEYRSIDPSQFKKGYNVQYFSLEMPFDQCFRRAFARLGTLPTYGLRDAKISNPEMLERMSQAANFIKHFPYQFEIVDIPRGVTINDIEDRYLDAVARGERPDVVVVDYLGLMQDPNAEGDDWLRLGHISGQLHEFARTYNVVMLSAVQLNRPSSRKPGDAIGLHRIGRSSLIMHHATVGVQIETRKDEESMTDLKYHIIKNRNGERGCHSLMKDFKTASLVDFEGGYQPKHESTYTSVNPAMEDISAVLDNFGWSAVS